MTADILIHEKVCRGCGASNPLPEFARNPKMADGHLNYCKPCVREGELSRGLDRTCERCGAAFKAQPQHVRRGEGRFCSRTCKNLFRDFGGERNPNWKGGRRVSRGRVLVKAPDHPYAQADGYVYEHRLIMESHIGRYLRPDEEVHHKNEDKSDNRIENLQLLSKAEHRRIHKSWHKRRATADASIGGAT